MCKMPAIEHIDIGGPSMLRSAAKNNDFVTVGVDPADDGRVLDEMRTRAVSWDTPWAILSIQL